MFKPKYLGLLLGFSILSAGCIPDLKKKASFQFSLTARGGSGSQNSSSGDLGSSDSLESDVETLTVFQKFAQVMNSRCLNCHKSGGSLAWFNGVQNPNEENWLALAQLGTRIKPGKANESSLYQLIVTDVVANRMPKGAPALSDQESADVAAWINSLPMGGSSGGNNTGDEMAMMTPFQKFAQVMNTRCLTCHQPGGSLGWFSGAQMPTETQWMSMAYQRSRIKPGKASESSLYQLIVTGVVASRMPKGLPPLPSPEAENVAAWINALPEEGGIDMGDQDTLQGPPSEFVTRVMDRKGLYRWFLARFGSTIDADARSAILGRPARFGGSCEVNHSTHIQPEDYCESVPSKDGLILTAPSVPDADIGREGYRMQLCRKALFSNDTGQPYSTRIHHALRGLEEFQGMTAQQIHAQLGQNAIPSRNQIDRMYGIFSGGRQASSEILNRLEALAQAAQSTGVQVVTPSTDRRQESWRYVLLALCYATDQQFL